MKVRKKKPVRQEEEVGGLWDSRGEVTVKIQAAIKVVQMAEALGFLDSLCSVLSEYCDRLGLDTADSPRLGERRIETCRGERDQENTVFTDPTSTGGNGKSSPLPLTELDLWQCLIRKQRRKNKSGNTGHGGQE
jgi:hypothetical protein